MGKHEELYEHILMRHADADVSVDELCSLLRHLGFQERITGDHYIFSRPAVEEILNVQPRGVNAKRYQVKQVREVILRYRLGVGE
jgi:predicted RNA binding protein YcfA (HicA-like mRNA interferase family)